jgi:signal transduction histidine kinase
MRFSLRWRIVLTLVPLLLLLAALGGAGAVLLYRVGSRIDAILRENYDSVRYMERLNESLERIDSSFVFLLAGRAEPARKQYEEHWELYRHYLDKERQNITLPGEAEAVQRLTALSEDYRRQGDAFFARPDDRAYFGDRGLLASFKEMKEVSNQILSMNQKHMEKASLEARATATSSLVWFGIGLVTAAVLAGWLAVRTVRAILQPIQAVTESALAIGAGNLDQVVPVLSGVELGQLAQAFNVMARHLRDYRQSHSAQLLRAQRTSQATIDSFPDAVLVIDAEGDVEMANPAARRLLGVVPRQEGQPATGTWQPPEPLRQPLAEALQGQRDYLPEGFDRALLLGANGRERAVLPRILTIRDPHAHTLGAAVVLQDVTRLRLLDQVKSNLVATASHELKTPLTSLRLAVHLLLEEAAGPLTPKQLELLLDARENSERLLAMVNNLLDLARLEQGWRQMDIRPESPGSLLQAAADTIRARAQDRSVELGLEVPDGLPPVAVDVERIGHALRNLLDNALTYTDRGGRITLSAAADGDALVLSVADTGIGIPPEHLPHVFEKFFRVPGQSRGSGTGLGLAIAHEIVTAHGGRITCESQPGVGTTFRLRLPVASGDLPQGFVFGHADRNQESGVRGQESGNPPPWSDL